VVVLRGAAALTSKRSTRRAFLYGAARAGCLATATVLAGACAGLSPFQATSAARQPTARLARVGYLGSGSVEMPDDPLGNLRAGLGELGYTENRNLVLETRFAEGQDDRLPTLVAELIALPVDVMVFPDTRPIPVAVRATRKVPLVMMFSTDPVGLGLAESLAHPGGNLTGLASLNLPLAGKRLEMLRDTVPGIRSVAVLHNPGRLMGSPEWDATQAAADALGLELLPLRASTRESWITLLQQPPPTPADALYVLPDVVFLTLVPEVIAFADQNRLPGMYGSKAFVDAGGLLTYVPDRTAMFRRAAYYVDRILKGGNPAEIPIEQPTRFEFVINMRTTRRLGVAISPTMLKEATSIVE
jgi:putative tryptophan/tyrosine transport system substrate-binding protein